MSRLFNNWKKKDFALIIRKHILRHSGLYDANICGVFFVFFLLFGPFNIYQALIITTITLWVDSMIPELVKKIVKTCSSFLTLSQNRKKYFLFEALYKIECFLFVCLVGCCCCFVFCLFVSLFVCCCVLLFLFVVFCFVFCFVFVFCLFVCCCCFFGGRGVNECHRARFQSYCVDKPGRQSMSQYTIPLMFLKCIGVSQNKKIAIL